MVAGILIERSGMTGERYPTAKGPTAEAARTRWHDIDQTIEGLRQNSPAAVEQSLRFLEENPNFHGSGYLKEAIWRRFIHAEVPARQLRRLEDVALAYLERRMTREFWCMARTMADRGSEAFWKDVLRVTQATDRSRKRRATALLAYEKGTAAGESMRKEVWYEAAKARAIRPPRR
jgi:hypothetical protein